MALAFYKRVISFFIGVSLGGWILQPGQANDAPTLQASIIKAYQTGEKKITIPPGIYRLKTPEGAKACLLFSGMKNFEIDATGVEFVGTDRKSTIFFFDRCENVTLRGAQIRHDPVPFSQGRIIEVSQDRKSLDIRIADGYPRDLDDKRYFAGDRQIIANVFDGATRLWRRDVGDIYGTEFVRMGPDLFRLMTKTPLPDVKLVGEPIAWRGNGTADIRIYQCARMHMLDLGIRSGIGFCIHESGGEGGNFYRYKVTRGPMPEGANEPPLFASNADAFHSSNVRKGPTLEDCLFEFTDDDGIPIHGSYALVADARTHTIAALSRDFCRIGDTLRIYDKAGAFQGSAKVEAFSRAKRGFQPQAGYAEGAQAFQDADRITFSDVRTSEPLILKEGWRIANSDALGSGFVIRRCIIRHVRARGILIKANDGLIENNLIEGTTMAGIALWPEVGYWDESDFSYNVIIRNNTLREVALWDTPGNGMAGALTIGAREEGHFVASREGHHNIVIEGNRFERNNGVNILLTTAKNVQIRNNTFLHPMQHASLRGKSTGLDTSSLIWITESRQVELKNNALSQPGPFLKNPLTTTSSCAEITQDAAFH